jgi:hypothetical protein
MPSTTTPTAETARELLRRSAALTTRMAELGARGTAAAAALTAPGTPPSDTLVHELADARREFATLRADVFSAAIALGLHTPEPDHIDSTKRLDAMLQLLLQGLELAERHAAATRAIAEAVAVLDRIAALRHRDDPAFAPLSACQSRAADVRAALAATKDADAAVAPFRALLTLMDGQQQLTDDQWGALEDHVAGVLGRPLAVAASRGKLAEKKR